MENGSSQPAALTHTHTRLFSGVLTAGDRLMVGDENSEVVAVFPAPPSGPDQVRKEGKKGEEEERSGEKNRRGENVHVCSFDQTLLLTYIYVLTQLSLLPFAVSFL